MTLTGQHISTVLRQVSAAGGQIATPEVLAAGLNDALRRAPAGLTVKGAAAFAATLAMESASFRATEEYDKDNWYAPWIGRSFIQLTHEGNYDGFDDWLFARGWIADKDAFTKNPRSLADIKWAWLGGVWFFERNGLWKYANAGDFLAVSQAVNGGNGTIGTSWKPNGWDARQAWYRAFLSLGNALLPNPKPTLDMSKEIAMATLAELETLIRKVVREEVRKGTIVGGLKSNEDDNAPHRIETYLAGVPGYVPVERRAPK